MVYEIVLGREEKDKDKWGTEGSVLLGKQYVKMGPVTTLSQPVYLDLNKAHVLFVCGKRGSGKSYCMGVIAEGIANLDPKFRDKLSVLMLDTMGIYWTMKYPNHQDEQLLKEWGFEGKAIDNVRIFTPAGYFKEYKEKGIPTDFPFAINPAELAPEDWNLTFDISANDPMAVFIERTVLTLKKEKGAYDIPDILAALEADEREEKQVKNAAINRFKAVQRWGVFSKDATPMKELAKAGTINILDLSPYAVMPGGWKIKHLVMGVVCEKMFIERMIVRKGEEFSSIRSAVHYIVEEESAEEAKLKALEMPIVWIMVDEAHEFLPKEGKTAASDALITLLREGRQPGVALVLATQQPGKIHTDAMTQSDIILAHRLTAKVDTDALGALLQSYLRTGLDQALENLPKVAGACLAVDDVNERMYPMRIRPRFSWHGGSAPNIIKEKKKIFEF
ncbi:ATP-binding protein [Candidatus Woesearchaeota archaeon]|nr:ATP-binding protein [Candidatus Woesearchaeota archaeon]